MHTQTTKIKPTDRPARRFRKPAATTGWHPEDIKAALRKAGSNQTALARELDRSPTLINHIINGRETSRRVAERIAEKLEVTLDELWPGQYHG